MLENIKNFHPKTSSINPRIGLQICKPISFPSSKPIYFWLAVKSPLFFFYLWPSGEKAQLFLQSAIRPLSAYSNYKTAICSVFDLLLPRGSFWLEAHQIRRPLSQRPHIISYLPKNSSAPEPTQRVLRTFRLGSGPESPSLNAHSVRWKFRTEPITLSLAEALTCLSSMLASIRALRIHIFFVREDRSWAAAKGSRSLWVHPLQFLLRNPNFYYFFVFTVSAPLLAVHHVWAWRLRF